MIATVKSRLHPVAHRVGCRSTCINKYLSHVSINKHRIGASKYLLCKYMGTEFSRGDTQELWLSTKLLDEIIDSRPPIRFPPPIFHICMFHHLVHWHPLQQVSLNSNNCRRFGWRLTRLFTRDCLMAFFKESHTPDRQSNGSCTVDRRRCSPLQSVS